LEKIIPRRIENEEQLKSFNPYLLRNFQNVEIESVNQGILTPIYDLMDRGGKRWRPVLGMVFAECYGVNVAYHIENPSEKQSINYAKTNSILYACGLTEIVHNGSLMVDDFEDKSLKRRGKPCTYIKYGEDVAVNTGTLMYYAPTIKMAEFVECEKTRYACQKIY
jgi:geranylgeranyl pyrophosphate synthase